MKLFSIEGNTQKLDGGAMYGNAPRELWKSWSPPDEKNRIPLACRALLVRTDNGRNILFETGIGSFFEDKLKDRYGVVEKGHVLLESLKKAGFTDEDIHTVVLSHLHFDHAGGLLSPYGEGPLRLLFPNAKYYVGRTQWKRAKKPHFRDKASYIPPLLELLEASGRLVFVEDDGASDLSDLVTFIFSNGHTPGLMMSRLKLKSGPLVFVADLIPGAPWVHVPITMGYDRYPELLIEEKQALLGDLAKNNGKIFLTHDPNMICGAVLVDERGRFSARSIDLSTLA